MEHKFKTIVGIDISKNTFDACLMAPAADAASVHREFSQNPKGFLSFKKWIDESGASEQDVLICMEHTGLYINGLIDFLMNTNFFVWVEMPLRIKKSIGLQRGGNDKLSSQLIMQYAYRYQDAARQWIAEDSFLQRLRHFTAQRQRLLTSLHQLEVPVKELAESGCVSIATKLTHLQKGAIRSIEKSIALVEAQINTIIEQNTEARENIARVSSLKGVSLQTAINLYVYTKGFKTFDTAKQLASYCGVVPFERKSGISVRYKPKISPYSNKALKKLLHMCAMSAIQHDKELKAYYERKVGAGKNKMSVINAVRNKLILRIFAVVRDNRNWVQNYDRKCV